MIQIHLPVECDQYLKENNFGGLVFKLSKNRTALVEPYPPYIYMIRITWNINHTYIIRIIWNIHHTYIICIIWIIHHTYIKRIIWTISLLGRLGQEGVNLKELARIVILLTTTVTYFQKWQNLVLNYQIDKSTFYAEQFRTLRYTQS